MLVSAMKRDTSRGNQSDRTIDDPGVPSVIDSFWVEALELRKTANPLDLLIATHDGLERLRDRLGLGSQSERAPGAIEKILIETECFLAAARVEPRNGDLRNGGGFDFSLCGHGRLRAIRTNGTKWLYVVARAIPTSEVFSWDSPVLAFATSLDSTPSARRYRAE